MDSFTPHEPPRQPLRHVLSSSQFDRRFLDDLVQLTSTIRRFDKTRAGIVYLRMLLPHRRAILYVTQRSARTFLSFQSACHILGITASEIRDPSTSSERKGESVEDSLRTFSSDVDLIINHCPSRGCVTASQASSTGRRGRFPSSTRAPGRTRTPRRTFSKSL